MGIALGERLGGLPAAWLGLAGLACLLLLARLAWLRSRQPAALPAPGSLEAVFPNSIPMLSLLTLTLLILVGLGLGGARLRLAVPPNTPGQMSWYARLETPVAVGGLVVRPPDERDQYTNLVVRAERLTASDHRPPAPVRGLLLASLPPGGDWQYGDRVSLQGVVELPPEGEEFSYREYLAHQGIYAVMSRPAASLLARGQGSPFLAAIYRLRQRGLDAVYRLFPDPEASLLAGILLGVETGIPESVQQAFRDTGTAHIIAISGFNIAILVALFAAGFGRLLGPGRIGQRRGALLAVAVIGIYAILVGGSASVVRAAIMGGMALLAAQLGRPQSGLNGLVIVAAVMALFSPYILWDIGFQLSFTAMLGLALFAEPLTEAFERFAARWMDSAVARRLSRPVGEYFLFTLAAGVMTLPVIVYHFQRLSLVSLLANPLVLPVQPLLMTLGGLAVILGMLWMPSGQPVAYLAWPFAVYTIRMVERLAELPLAALSVGKVGLPFVAAFYALLLGGVFGGPRLQAWWQSRRGAPASSIRPRLPRWLPVAALIVLVGLAVLAWQAVFALPDRRLHLTVLDVGSGEALLIRTPSGGQVLINGGPSPVGLSEALGRRLPLTRRRLDYLVVSGTENQSLAALPDNLERFPPRQVLWAGPPEGSRSARDLRRRLAEMDIPLTEAQTGHWLDLGDGVRMEVLAATRRGAVLLLSWGNFRALLPLGMDLETLSALQADPRARGVSAYLLADQGMAALNPPEWIAHLNPQVTLLSVGAADLRGLPDPEALQAVQGYNLLRTDENGWIELSTDGEQMWVEVERK